jgi:hypothetical protein
VALDPGGADEDRPQRLVADPLDHQVGLKALQLAAEGVAPGIGIEEAEVLGIADDHPGAGAEDRPAGFVVRAQRRLQAGGGDALDDRRALAAGDDEPVQPVGLGGGAYLGCLGAEPAQDAGMRLKPALER